MCAKKCDIIHEKAEDGLPLKESRQIREYNKEKFMLGTARITPGDTHLMEKILEATLKMSFLTKNTGSDHQGLPGRRPHQKGILPSPI